MSDFEPFDDELGTALRHRARNMGATALGTANAHDAVLARARGIRRRRAAIAGGATLAAVIVGGAFLLNGDPEDTLAPATQPSTSLAIETSAAPSTSAVQSTTSTPETSVTVAASSISTTGAPTTTASTVVAGSPTNPPATSTSSSSTSSSSSSSTSTSLAAQGPAPFTKTYNSAGGSITVTWDGTALSLGAVDPGADETVEVEDNTATRIRIRFHGPAESRIEIRFENGEVTERID